MLLVLMPQMGPLAAGMSAGSHEGGGERGDSETMCASHLQPCALKKARMERQTAKIAATGTRWTGSGAKEAASAWLVVSLLIMVLIKSGG